MASSEGGYSSASYSWGTGQARCKIDASVTNLNDDTCRVTISGSVRSGNDAGTAYRLNGYGTASQVGHDACNGAAAGSVNGSGIYNYANWIAGVSGTWDIPRSKNATSMKCWCKYWGAEVNGYGAASNSGEVDVTVTIPARPYYAHGNPSFSSPKTTVHYGEEITLSWGKSGTQGNANFVRFELYHDDANKAENRMYSGTGTSMKVKPSDYTGPKGGTVTLSLWELHDWYGENKWTHTDITITVRSGVVSVYDGSEFTLEKKILDNAELFDGSVSVDFSVPVGGGKFEVGKISAGSATLKNKDTNETVALTIDPDFSSKTAMFYCDLPEGAYTLSIVGSYIMDTPVNATLTYNSKVPISGKKHVGLVSAYDSDGKKHYVLITAYDENGKAHNVI